MKTQIGLGVLSIPSAFDALGIVPGVICLCVIAAITTWSDFMVGTFKLRHPQVYGIDDAGGLMFGRVGREALGVAFVLCELNLTVDEETTDIIKSGSLWQDLVCSVFPSVSMPSQPMGHALLFSLLLLPSLDSSSPAFEH